MSNQHEGIIPGLTQQQTDILTLVIREAVAEGVREAFERREEETCAMHCAEVARVRKDLDGHHSTLYGADGAGGIVLAVADLQSRMKLVLWVGATIGASSIVAVVTAIATLVRTGG